MPGIRSIIAISAYVDLWCIHAAKVMPRACALSGWQALVWQRDMLFPGASLACVHVNMEAQLEVLDKRQFTAGSQPHILNVKLHKRLHLFICSSILWNGCRLRFIACIGRKWQVAAVQEEFVLSLLTCSDLRHVLCGENHTLQQVAKSLHAWRKHKAGNNNSCAFWTITKHPCMAFTHLHNSA